MKVSIALRPISRAELFVVIREYSSIEIQYLEKLTYPPQPARAIAGKNPMEQHVGSPAEHHQFKML